MVSRRGKISLSPDRYRPVTAAIDFGTTSSGYAFAFQSKADKPVKYKDIHLNQWKKGSASSTIEKAPTTVLLRPDISFDSFGYKAENRYAKLCDTGKHKGWRYFQKFKMLLYNAKNLSRDAVIYDAEFKPMPAISVFSIVIRHLKEKLLGEIKIQNNAIRDDDILYVLTVPAIWSDAAKQFMREAATSSYVGISNEQLKLVLEPEAASVYCRQTQSGAIRGTDGRLLRLTSIPIGHKYVIVDLGGGTADLASHKVVNGEKLYEIHNARGDDMGGEQFNIRFLEVFLADLVGIDVFEQFRSKEHGDYLALQRTVEGVKWEASDNDADEEILCPLPNSLLEFLEESEGNLLEEQVKQSKYRRNVKVYGKNKLLLKLRFIRNMFVDVLRGLEKHIKDIRDGEEEIDTLFMVGGMAKSEYVRRYMQKQFPKGNFVIPEDPGVAVLKGAVLLGNRRNTIAGRIANYSYGLGTCANFIEGEHEAVNKIVHDGRMYCDNLFSRVVTKGTVMKFGDVVRTSMMFTAKLAKTKLKPFICELFQSVEEDPTYTNEEGCSKLGGLYLYPPKNGWDDNTQCEVLIIVGEAEFRFYVKEQSGQECQAKVDFLLPTVSEK